MLSTTWARKRPAGMLDSSAAETGMTRVPEPSLRELFSLPQLQLQSMDPRYVSQGPRWSTACAKVSLLPSPSISVRYVPVVLLPRFQAHPLPKAHPAAPKKNVFLPSKVAFQGLLDSYDIPLRLFDLLRCLEEADAQGLPAALAGTVDLFAAPRRQCCPSSLLPSTLPAQFLIQKVKHIAGRLTAARRGPSGAVSLCSAFPRFALVQLSQFPLLQHFSALVEGFPSRKHHSLHRLHSAIAILP